MEVRGTAIHAERSLVGDSNMGRCPSLCSEHPWTLPSGTKSFSQEGMRKNGMRAGSRTSGRQDLRP